MPVPDWGKVDNKLNKLFMKIWKLKAKILFKKTK
jgi:hypothetical protein